MAIWTVARSTALLGRASSGVPPALAGWLMVALAISFQYETGLAPALVIVTAGGADAASPLSPPQATRTALATIAREASSQAKGRVMANLSIAFEARGRTIRVPCRGVVRLCANPCGGASAGRRNPGRVPRKWLERR